MTLLLVELEKLRTIRSTWLLFAIGVLAPLPLTLIALLSADDLTTIPQDAVNLVTVPGIFAASLAAAACAREFEHKTIAVSFMLEPRRERVIAAKALAACIVGLAMATLFFATSFGLSAVWLSSSGEAWPWSGLQTLHAIGGSILLVGAVAVAGTGFGGMLRHVGAAITLLLGVTFVAEAALAAVFTVWQDYGLSAASNTLLEPAMHHDYSLPVAMLLIVGLALATLAAGIAVARRADV